MKLPTSIMAGVAAACIMLLLCGSTAQAQSVITNVYPNGTNMFQPSPTLTFTASSPAGVTNVTVALTVKSLYTGQSFIKSLTAVNGLTITGPTTSLSVSAVLTSNTLYSAAIQIKDADGAVANQTVAFDTINPTYTWEAEDWDYTDTGSSTSGLFIDNPQTNAYAGLATTVEGSGNNGPGAYRPTTPAPSTEGAGDIPRLKYIGTGFSDYDVGWTDGSEFANYTRHYPAGTYNLFARAAGGNGVRTESADITVLSGSTVISGTGPYKFGVQGRGWQSYDFMPVTDNAGNLIQITFDGNPSTLQALQNQASDNMNFFMLMPLNTNAPVATVAITNLYPNGAFQFQATNKFSFTASSSAGGINPSDVTLQLTGTNLSGQGFVTNLTTANGLIITGNSTDISVTAPLMSNTVYTAFVQVNDASGIPASASASFDTIIPAYTFEAEDWNYGGGAFIDNPQTNAYATLASVAEIDYHRAGGGGGEDYGRTGLAQEGASDVPRVTHVGFPDYDIGNAFGGNWANYTRTFPAGIYNIYVRVSRGDGGTQVNAGSISLVTGATTAEQTASLLGNFNAPTTGNWQRYIWMPVKNANGDLVRVTGGGEKTLRYTVTGGGHNPGFFLLMPADLGVNPPPYVSDFKPDGTSLFQFTNRLSFVANSSVGILTSDILVNVDGANVSGVSFSGSSAAWNVSAPVAPNATHTAIITLIDTAGTSKYTNTFGAFSSTNYQWEAEDYNYDNGKFFDNQINAYSTLGSVADVDNHQSNLGANPFDYRASSAQNPAPSTQTGDIGGERPRELFTSGGGSGIDYCIGFFGNGSWVNYTRHFPAGTYNIVGRFAEGQNLTQPTMSLVTGDTTTTSQTANLLGSFDVLPIGWSSWEWVTLKGSDGKPVKIMFDGSPITLRYSGSTVGGQPELNTGFFMLAATTPDVTLTATVSGGNIVISFPTQNGFSYQVQYKNSLSDANWTPLGSAIAGNGAVQSASDPAAGSGRFYRVQIQ